MRYCGTKSNFGTDGNITEVKVLDFDINYTSNVNKSIKSAIKFKIIITLSMAYT